jgi:O-methyltransferase domain/Dimerisation domain
MINGYWISQIVGTLAQLEVADHLAAGPLQCPALAELIGCGLDATFRLLRASVHVGLMATLGRFGLTPLGELLRSDVPGSMRDSAMAFTAPGHWLPWGRLTQAVRRGERQAVAALGHEFFDYLAANPEEGDAFTGAMADLSKMIASEVAQVLDTSNVGHLVDIGGASGTIVGALLEANPALRGTIFERAEVVPRAEAAIAERGLSARCRVVAGDFFESVPEADLYILKTIVHDWDDRQSVKILGNCARALQPNGRVVLIERVVAEQGDLGEAALFDLNMLVLLPGRERTVSQYKQLLATSGLRLDRVLQIGSARQIIEASAESA